ncbi:MAG: sugar phosphate isomerase/epimerase [Chitinophagaceae bacterium]
MKRRRFLQASGIATGSLLLSSLDNFATPLSAIKQKTFQLKILATSWGSKDSMDLFCSKVKKEGYDGIEVWWPTESQARQELYAAVAKHGLDLGFLCAGTETVFDQHFTTFKNRVSEAVTSTQKPLYINCHSGKDYFSFDQNRQLIEYTMNIAAKTGIKICHETHRSRMLFAAPVAKRFLETIPGLRITMDISHWCNVSESLLADQQQTVDLAIQRTDHIHARIGHPEGPQVSDPRAPEWEPACKAHFGWWDKVVELKKQQGETLTILTEFGPVDYMPALPYTRQPVADQWAINYYMMQTLRKRYS